MIRKRFLAAVQTAGSGASALSMSDGLIGEPPEGGGWHGPGVRPEPPAGTFAFAGTGAQGT